MADPVKILAVGSTAGSIKDLFAKIKTIDAKHGKFDLVLCTGDFFGEVSDSEDETTKLLAGELEAPIDCYIMQGQRPLPEQVVEKFAKTGGELCPKVFLLSKSGIITTAHGLRIACLAGTYDANFYASADAAPGFLSPFFSSHTLEKLLSNSLSKSANSQSYKSLSAIQSSASFSQLIDIFMTNVWPSAITELSNVPLPLPELASSGATELDETIRRIKPRYHFASAGGKPPQFWEREPYVWDDEEGRVSRFIGLGAFGGEAPPTGKKPRWFYAFSITPNVSGSTARPANASRNPFKELGSRPVKRPHEPAQGENFIFGDVRPPPKRSRLAQGEPGKPPPGYKCRRCESTEHFINDCPERAHPPDGYPGHFVRDCPTRDEKGDTGGKKPKPGYSPINAHHTANVVSGEAESAVLREKLHRRNVGFASRILTLRESSGTYKILEELLMNINRKHLIVGIGSECYVTLPKGQIIPTQSSANSVAVPGGGHVLIVPITHFPTFTTLPPDLAGPIVNETEKYNAILTRLFIHDVQSLYKSAIRAMYAKHGAVGVVFEVGLLRAKGGHAHVQAVPVPLKLKDKIENAFIQEGRQFGIDFEEDAEAAMESCSGGNGSYFKVELPDGRKMVHLIRENVPFNVQFGRQVLVNVMGIADRLDWRACMLPEDEDKADASAFKAAFAPFDPSG
ncbi:hypothetical protein H0H92_000090 [Tricholoma furcatifolium]|nr:hypothetical protein H0H92_000090 [Tricholoma furcatifolium]